MSNQEVPPPPVTAEASKAEATESTTLERSEEHSIEPCSRTEAAPPSLELSDHSANTSLWTKVNVFIQSLTLCALFVQGCQMMRQTYIYEDQLRANQGQLEEMRHSNTFSALGTLRQSGFNAEEIVYRSGSIFEIARSTECRSLPPLSTRDKSEIRQVIGHYESYFDASRLHLIDEAEWSQICENAAELITGNCLLAQKWRDAEFRRYLDVGFRDSIEHCMVGK
jgi:hypothetical protein